MLGRLGGRNSVSVWPREVSLASLVMFLGPHTKLSVPGVDGNSKVIPCMPSAASSTQRILSSALE